MFVALTTFYASAQNNGTQYDSIQELNISADKIKIFPNPASNVVNILGLQNSTRAKIVISDISGNTVLQHEWAIRNNAVSIPIPNLNAGIYVVRIESIEQKIQTKFYKN